MASVYAATDTRLDRPVAVKVMRPGLADDPEFVERFGRDARAAARLSSPEVVAVHDQGTDAGTGTAHVVLERVSGGTLRDVLHGQGALPRARALDLLEPVLVALAAAHAAGLVHRDAGLRSPCVDRPIWQAVAVPPRKPSAVGSHVPTSGGLVKALAYAQEIGARAVQVFVSNPRGWAPSPGDPAQDDAFKGRCADDGTAVYVHAPYLVNFGSPTEATLTKSVTAVEHALRRGRAIGARGVVVHAGSAVAGAHRDDAMAQLRTALLPVLDAADPDGPRLLVEPTAGGGQALAATVQELEPWFSQLDRHEMLGVCLDTCHAFAAGHDVSSPGGMKKTLDALVKAVGRGRLELVHANDSKDPLGSTRDRHEAIGEGHIGKDAFAELFRHPATRGVPVLVETPGDASTHRRDIELLCQLRDG